MRGLWLAILMTAAPCVGVALAQQAFQGPPVLPSTVMPPATGLDGAVGSSTTFARSDHTHAARVQRTTLTTATDGTAVWTFARPIVVTSGALPVIAYMVEDQGTPVVVQVTARSFTSADGLDTHTAVTFKAMRSQTLPATLVAVTTLANFNVFGGSPAAVKVNLYAADPTQ